MDAQLIFKNLSIFQYAFLFFLTTLYLFSFRTTVKDGAFWGAFEFREPELFKTKFVPYSVPLFILIPLFFYVLFSSVVINLSERLVDLFPLVIRVFIITITVIFLAQFPRVGKHAWLLKARKKIQKGSNKGQPGFGWINSNTNIDTLPHKYYSWQVVCLLGLPSILILLVMVFLGIDFSIGIDFFLKLYASVYISQIIVLNPIGKARGFYNDPDKPPKYLMRIRMFLTISIANVLPMAFGIFISPLLFKLTAQQHILYIICLVIYLIMALPFPLYCNQGLLIIGKRRKWRSEERCSVYMESGTRSWWRCVYLAALSVLILFLLYCFTDIGMSEYALITDKIQQIKSVVHQ